MDEACALLRHPPKLQPAALLASAQPSVSIHLSVKDSIQDRPCYNISTPSFLLFLKNKRDSLAPSWE